MYLVVGLMYKKTNSSFNLKFFSIISEGQTGVGNQCLCSKMTTGCRCHCPLDPLYVGPLMFGLFPGGVVRGFSSVFTVEVVCVLCSFKTFFHRDPALVQH